MKKTFVTILVLTLVFSNTVWADTLDISNETMEEDAMLFSGSDLSGTDTVLSGEPVADNIITDGTDEETGVSPEVNADEDGATTGDIDDCTAAGTIDDPIDYTLGTEVSGYLNKLTSVYYEFTVEKNGYIQPYVALSNEGGSRDDFYIYHDSVYDSNLVFRKDYITNGDYKNIGRSGLKPGKYIVCLRSIWGGNYRIKIDFKATDFYEEEPDSETSPKKIMLGKTYYGETSNAYGDTADYYCFTLPKRSVVKVHGTTYENFYLGIGVFSDKAYSKKVKMKGYAYKDIDYEGDLSAGTYYVKVTNGLSATAHYGYEFRISAEVDYKDIGNATVTGIKDKKYTGKAIKQKPVVRMKSKKLKEGTDYTISYSKNKNAGTATVTIKGKGDYKGKKKVTFEIKKASNPIKATASDVVIKYSDLKKKNVTIKADKAFKVTGSKGKVKYDKTGGNEKIEVAEKGTVTVKKGLKKGTYKIKLKVTAKGNANYKKGSKNVTLKITVK